MKAFILVGGLATRLGDLAKQTPKAMQIISGKPFLQYQLEQLRGNGIKDIVLCVGHLAQPIVDYFGDGSKFGLNISYSYENAPLGTGGAVKNAEKFVDGTFLVLNGDTYVATDYLKLIQNHKQHGAKISIVLNKIADCSNYGSVVLDSNNCIIRFAEKKYAGGGLINAGIYLIEQSVLKEMPANQKFSMEADIFPKFVEKKQAFGIDMPGYFMDIGIPARLEQFRKDIESGLLRL